MDVELQILKHLARDAHPTVAIVDEYCTDYVARQYLESVGKVDNGIVSVNKLLKQYRQTQEISPKPFNGGVKLKLTPDKLEVLADLIEDNNDATKRGTVFPAEGKEGYYY